MTTKQASSIELFACRLMLLFSPHAYALARVSRRVMHTSQNVTRQNSCLGAGMCWKTPTSPLSSLVQQDHVLLLGKDVRREPRTARAPRGGTQRAGHALRAGRQPRAWPHTATLQPRPGRPGTPAGESKSMSMRVSRVCYIWHEPLGVHDCAQHRACWREPGRKSGTGSLCL